MPKCWKRWRILSIFGRILIAAFAIAVTLGAMACTKSRSGSAESRSPAAAAKKRPVNTDGEIPGYLAETPDGLANMFVPASIADPDIHPIQINYAKTTDAWVISQALNQPAQVSIEDGSGGTLPLAGETRHRVYARRDDVAACSGLAMTIELDQEPGALVYRKPVGQDWTIDHDATTDANLYAGSFFIDRDDRPTLFMDSTAYSSTIIQYQANSDGTWGSTTPAGSTIGSDGGVYNAIAKQDSVGGVRLVSTSNDVRPIYWRGKSWLDPCRQIRSTQHRK